MDPATDKIPRCLRGHNTHMHALRRYEVLGTDRRLILRTPDPDLPDNRQAATACVFFRRLLDVHAADSWKRNVLRGGMGRYESLTGAVLDVGIVRLFLRSLD